MTKSTTRETADVASIVGRKNLIINGAMQVSQRGASFSTQGHTLDRWYLNLSGGSGIVTSSAFAAGSEVDGIKNYLALDVTAGNNYLGMIYKVEGARSLPTGKATLSWWAKGINPAGGAFDCNMQLVTNGTTVFNTPLSDSFSVTSAWQKYVRVVDIPSYSGMTAETSDGSWTYIRLAQPAGDTSTDAWSLDITGVQLEAGSVATDFEHRSYGEELALCQRYYWQGTLSNGEGVRYGYATAGSNRSAGSVTFPTTMKSEPTMAILTTPNYNNCSDESFSYTSPNGFSHGVIVIGTSMYRAYWGLYSADAEL
jgi:hypothetical protein